MNYPVSNCPVCGKTAPVVYLEAVGQCEDCEVGQGLYAVTATVTQSGITRQVPTFYLHKDVQGIVSVEHARQIALDILGYGWRSGRINIDVHEI